MRTTLNMDDDVLDRVREVAEKLGRPFRLVLNEALRIGLKDVGKHCHKKTYRTKPRRMGLRRPYSLDNIRELLSEVEGEKSR